MLSDFFFVFINSGLYDPLKVDVWSLGATTWELVHGDPPFADVQDTRHVCGTQLPPVRQPDAFSRSFHDFLHLCSQPAASRPDPDELLNVRLFLSVDRSIDHVLTFFLFLFCRFILYGLRAHALRLSGCWVSVRRSTSSSYFDRVAILTDISIYFFQTNVGQSLFFAFIYSLLPLCLQ